MSEALIYVTEWTAPDGSKRRPLVERVPECCPQRVPGELDGNYFLRRKPHSASDTMFHWHRSDEDDGYGSGHWGNLDFCEAAALLRCAVEDWLVSPPIEASVTLGSAVVQHIEPLGDTRNVVIAMYSATVQPEIGEEVEGFGPTIHHALVAAAHAVADAQGVPA